MYFQKPADALTATGADTASSAGVAQLNNPAPASLPVPDAAPPTLPPPPPPSRYLPPDKPITAPLPAPTLARPVSAPPVRPLPVTPVSSAQPDLKPGPGDPIQPGTVLKKDVKIVPVDPKYVQLPPRETVFMVYDDQDLERAIIARLIQDRIADQQTRLKEARAALKEKKDPNEIAELEKVIAALEKTLLELQSIKDPLTELSYRFPPLPVISPPGVAYQSKTSTYEPRKAILEPSYVVHRRLYFEEKNSERIGWDFGPAQTLVSSVYFWKDVLSLPHNVASGCVYGFWDTSAGKCLPGSPSPYYLYPPGLTLTGSLTEALVITSVPFIFP
jgi:hypothetical protein